MVRYHLVFYRNKILETREMVTAKNLILGYIVYGTVDYNVPWFLSMALKMLPRYSAVYY
jgi:hypothetical protein